MASNTGEGSQSILTDKVNRALQVRTDTPAMKAALDALGTQSLVDARTVRHCMEDDALQQALQLQARLSRLVQAVSELKEGTVAMADLCRAVSRASQTSVVTEASQPETLAHEPNGLEVSSSKEGLIQEHQLASTLAAAFHKRNVAREHLRGVELVLEELDPSPADARLIRHYVFDDIINGHSVNAMAFLNALETLSRQLKATAASVKTLSYLDTLHVQQEQAYERLYHWLQSYIQAQQEEDNDDEESPMLLETELVTKSVALLRKHVPAFGNHIVEMIAQERRSWATKHFLLALTQGVNGRPPLEVRAHDAVAYSGDMLAHVFQTVNSLDDICNSILTSNNDDKDESKQDNETDQFLLDSSEDVLTPASMLSISTGGLARPLKSRILQVVSSLTRRPDQNGIDSDDDDDLDLESMDLQTRLERLYDIAGLLLFYRSAMLKTTLVEDTAVVQAVTDCLLETTAGLEATMRVYGATLEASTAAANVCRLWQSLAEWRTTSPGLGADHGLPQIEPVLSLEWMTETLLAACLPLVQQVTDVALLRHGLRACQVAGLDLVLSQRLEEQLEGLHTTLVDELVERETQKVLDTVGLLDLQGDSWSPHALEEGLTRFYASLYAPPLPSLEGLEIRRQARLAICQRVTRVYRHLHEVVTNSGDADLLKHTPEQVETLFTP